MAGGGTPLCRHVREIITEIQGMESELHQNMQKICLIIATDGQASDGTCEELRAALNPLHDLPVWLVVRLCTDANEVIEYWNDIDMNLEVNMDILDDLMGEAKEVNEHNKWVTYGQPLHLLRQFGVSVPELDLLDERPLTAEEVRNVCHIM